MSPSRSDHSRAQKLPTKRESRVLLTILTFTDIQELDLPREDGSYVELEDPGIQELDLPEKDGSYAELEDPYTDPDVVSEDPRRRRSRR